MTCLERHGNEKCKGCAAYIIGYGCLKGFQGDFCGKPIPLLTQKEFIQSAKVGYCGACELAVGLDESAFEDVDFSCNFANFIESIMENIIGYIIAGEYDEPENECRHLSSLLDRVVDDEAIIGFVAERRGEYCKTCRVAFTDDGGCDCGKE